MRAIKNPKRIPRKLKKEIKKIFFSKDFKKHNAYKEIMKGRMFIAPKIVTNMTGDDWVEQDHGMTLFFVIDE